MPLIPNPPPGKPQGNPYQPPLPDPQMMEAFEGINTSTTRAGVPDKQCYWIDGFMPIAPRNLRTLPGVGIRLGPIFDITIVMFGFYNIGEASFALYFMSDGSVLTTAGVEVVQILPPGSIFNPSITQMGFSQWGQNYIIIVANQVNGYWVWDGSVLYEAGTLSPIVTLTNPGSAYQTVPSVTVSGGSGSGAVLVASIANGVVTGVSITNPGSGYLAGQSVSVIFAGGNSSGSGASLTAQMLHAQGSGASINVFVTNVSGAFQVTGGTVIAGGSGYSPFTALTVSGGASLAHGAPVQALLTPLITGGTITGVDIATPGNYGALTPTPVVSIADTGDYYVGGVSIVAAGSGYSDTATAVVAGGSVITSAALSLVVNSGSISSVLITNGGQYGSSVAPTITVADVLGSAAATVTLMPFGIQGTAVETYQGRAWVADGPIFYWTAPGSFTDFATSDGGGNQTSGDSFLRVGYTRFVNTNGFLYLIADSSMNYISGVSTSGTPPTTTFTNQNADPQVGTPYPASVLCLGRDIMLANSFGVHVSRGAALEKVSEPLDGVFNSVPSTDFIRTPFNGFQLSSAKATVFAKVIWMVLVPIVDPVSGATVNKLLIWNGKFWYASVQDFGPLTFIATQEINSVLVAWGTDGNSIMQLFQVPSVGFQKVVRSRYWDAPGGYQFDKAVGRFFSIWDYNVATTAPNLIVDIDAVGINGADGTTFTNTQSYTITGPSGSGYFITPPQATGQQGVLTGMTLLTNASDVSLVSAMIQSDPKIAYRG